MLIQDLGRGLPCSVAAMLGCWLMLAMLVLSGRLGRGEKSANCAAKGTGSKAPLASQDYLERYAPVIPQGLFNEAEKLKYRLADGRSR
jgi:hypothetical protein